MTLAERLKRLAESTHTIQGENDPYYGGQVIYFANEIKPILLELAGLVANVEVIKKDVEMATITDGIATAQFSLEYTLECLAKLESALKEQE